MKQIIVFGGSTSSTSINKKLATFAATLLKETEFKVLDLNDYKVPIYSVDEEIANGIPDGALSLNDEFDAAAGFIVSLAEHNGSYAAAFKNLLDWVSRKEKKIFREKPLLLLATSPGGRGAATVLGTATLTFPHFGANVTGSFSLPSFNDNFKEDKIINSDFSSELAKLVEAFEKEV